MPEVAKWSRDTMSEIPALAFVLLATFALLRWLETSRYRDGFLMFGFATLAFFSKLNVIGALLAWPLWVLLRGQWRKAALAIPAHSCVRVCDSRRRLDKLLHPVRAL
jgi:4-amino-4-deoxy-L-arabinose transferase-like glycosyltransferase